MAPIIEQGNTPQVRFFENAPIQRRKSEKPFHDGEMARVLQRPDVKARLQGKVEHVGLYSFGGEATKKDYVVVDREDGKRYVFPGEHSRKETEGVGEAVLLVPVDILGKAGWLPDPHTGFLAFDATGPKSFEAFSQFVAANGMFGDRHFVDPISAKNAPDRKTQKTYPGDPNFLQIIPVGVQKNGVGETFTVVRKEERQSVNFRAALAGVTIQSTFLGHINDHDETRNSEELIHGAAREAQEEMRTVIVFRRLFTMFTHGKSPIARREQYQPFDLSNEYFTYHPRGLVFTPNIFDQTLYERFTAKSDVSNVHMGLIFDVTPTGKALFDLFHRAQVGIGAKEENKLGVYLSKRQYKRWERGFDFSREKDKRHIKRWLACWKRMGYVAQSLTIEDIPPKILTADWNPVLAA